jgi:hypothetical protein
MCRFSAREVVVVLLMRRSACPPAMLVCVRLLLLSQHHDRPLLMSFPEDNRKGFLSWMHQHLAVLSALKIS